MWPIVLGIPARPLFFALAIGVGTAVTISRAGNHGFSTNVFRFALLLVVAGLLGLAGAKLDSLIERDGGFQSPLWELQRGYRYPGGMIAVLLLVPVFARFLGVGRSILALGDLAAPAAAIAMAVVRIGCFLAGCCHGTISTLPWAVSFPPESFAWTRHVSMRMIRADALTALPVHPLQLYFVVWSLGLACFLLWVTRHRTHEGQVLFAYVALDNLMKFALEYLRDPRVPHLQWLSLAIGAAAAGVLLIGSWRARMTAPVQGTAHITAAPLPSSNPFTCP